MVLEVLVNKRRIAKKKKILDWILFGKNLLKNLMIELEKSVEFWEIYCSWIDNNCAFWPSASLCQKYQEEKTLYFLDSGENRIYYCSSFFMTDIYWQNWKKKFHSFFMTMFLSILFLFFKEKTCWKVTFVLITWERKVSLNSQTKKVKKQSMLLLFPIFFLWTIALWHFLYFVQFGLDQVMELLLQGFMP